MLVNSQQLSDHELNAIAYSMSWIGADFVQEFQEILLVPLLHRKQYRVRLAEIFPNFAPSGVKAAVCQWFHLLQTMGEDTDRICCWLFSMLEEDGKHDKRQNWEKLFIMPREDDFFNDLNTQRDQVSWIFDSYLETVFNHFQKFDHRLQLLESEMEKGFAGSSVDQQIQGWPDGSWSDFGISNFYWKYLVRLQRDWLFSIQDRLTKSDLDIIDDFYKRKYVLTDLSSGDGNSHLCIKSAFARYRGLNFWDYCSVAS